MSHYGRDVVFVTITAPGSDRLPDAASMMRWNRSAARRWRPLHRAARQAAQRACGTAPKLLAWSWEYQKRGALHKHLILGAGTAAEFRAAHHYVEHLAQLRGLHDFGFVDRGRRSGGRRARVLPLIAAEIGARYAAKYLSPLSEGGKPTLSETVTREDVPPLVVYVSRELTAATGITMRYLRWVRHAWFLGVDPDTGEVVDRIPMDREQLLLLLAAAGSPPDL